MENYQCNKMDFDPNDIPAVAKNKIGFYSSLLLIVFTNLLLMGVALKAGLSTNELIWLYWCEGVIIGVFQFFKLFSTEITSFTAADRSMSKEPNVILTILFFALQIPFHAFFAFWIYHIEPTFDYVHGLLVMGGVIFVHEFFHYIRNSRPWSEPNDLRDVIVESGIYFLRFIPLIALYYFIVKKAVGQGNKTVLTLGFMFFKLISDVITYLIEERIKKDDS